MLSLFCSWQDRLPDPMCCVVKKCWLTAWERSYVGIPGQQGADRGSAQNGCLFSCAESGILYLFDDQHVYTVQIICQSVHSLPWRFKYHVVYFLIRHCEIFMLSCCRHLLQGNTSFEGQNLPCTSAGRLCASFSAGETRAQGGQGGGAVQCYMYISDLHLLAPVSYIVHTWCCPASVSGKFAIA